MKKRHEKLTVNKNTGLPYKKINTKALLMMVSMTMLGGHH